MKAYMIVTNDELELPVKMDIFGAKTIEGGVAMCSVTEVEQWLKAESEE